MPTKGPIAQDSGSSCGRVRPAGCHFNFAHAVTFQPCADSARDVARSSRYKMLIWPLRGRRYGDWLLPPSTAAFRLAFAQPPSTLLAIVSPPRVARLR